ncbi:MAG: nitroreductase Nfs [Lachnospiraceae bacterium]|nr:nitroreductase Nfs [Lachnospiraceae bacterium]
MNFEYGRPVCEVIDLRHSVRNYTDQAISADLLHKIASYIEHVTNPFGKTVRIKLIQKGSENRDLKLGTYGVIRGANYFLVTACEKDEISYLALGYALEKVILYCTSLGLGTVWLGGTFQRGEFAKAIELKEKEVLPIVAPVGYEGGKKTLLGTIFGNHGKQRKAFEDIFFDKAFAVPLKKENAGIYGEPLEMLRLAPSAVNKQPWRVVKDGENIHFYLVAEKGLNHVDLGIGLSHFHVQAMEKGINGTFVVAKDSHPEHKDYKYQISWIKE